MNFSIVPDESKRTLVIEHGKYSVYHDPLPHRPYGLYRVYHGSRYIGAQLSFPNRSDCEWLDRWKGTYARSSFHDHRAYGYRARPRGAVKRGKMFRINPESALPET